MDLSNDENSSSGSSVVVDRNRCNKKWGFMDYFGLSLILISILIFINMIILYMIPTNITKKNKKKMPDAHFERPNTVVILFHFLEHSSLIIFFISLILATKFEFKRFFSIIILIIPIIIFIVSYFVLFSCVNNSRLYTSQLNTDEMMAKLNVDKPIDFIFIYTHGKIKHESCHTDSDGHRDCDSYSSDCYSKKGVKYPLISKRISNVYNFSNVPSVFYFNIKYKLTMSMNAASCFNRLIKQASSCIKNFDVITENHPINEGLFIVSNGKIPIHLKKTAKNAAMTFGAGVFYEIYTKSIPSIDYEMEIFVDSLTGEKCEVSINCNDYGIRCDDGRKKPEP